MSRRYEAHARSPPKRMLPDAQLYVPFKDNFTIATLHANIPNRTTAHRWEAFYTTQLQATDPCHGYNTLVGTPVANRRYWGMQNSRSDGKKNAVPTRKP
jgi:hypothetical protein